jgi:predicted HD superfamily hydrolase involved in NAD metabolism
VENERLRQLLQKRFSFNRYCHSLRVADFAVRLADRHGADENKAYLAGLLHDYSRDLPAEKLLSLARQSGMTIHPVEYLVPVLLHAPVGACLVREETSISDIEILNSVSLHTVGGTKMTKLDKIIYLADIAEPDRNFQGVEEIRSLALRDLNQAMIVAFRSTINYILTKETYIHPATIEGYNEILAEINKCSLRLEFRGRE